MHHFINTVKILFDYFNSFQECNPFNFNKLEFLGALHPSTMYKSTQDTILNNFHFFTTPKFCTI